MSACGVCSAPNVEDIEEVGKLCLRGELSWRKGAEKAGYHNYTAFKNHMDKHYVPPAAAEAARNQDELDLKLQREIDQAAGELLEQMSYAPPELKPLFAVAVKNLRGIQETKPSQQHMIAALKAIHEITGMRIEQQTMLQFARHAFPAPAKVEAIEHSPIPALEAVKDVMEVEELDA